MLALVIVLILIFVGGMYYHQSSKNIVSKKLKMLMKADPEIKNMLSQSILKAKQINPDKNYNPVQSLEDFYNYADQFAHSLPGEIPPGNLYKIQNTVTRESVHQNIMYFYFLVNQPLEQLKNQGLFKNTLQYYPKFNEWLIFLTQEKGRFLSSSKSWSNKFFEQYKKSPSFNFDKGWYVQENIWHSYNDFFSRDVLEGTRPTASPDDSCIVTSPADSVPKGMWRINQDNKIDVEKGLKFKFLSYFSIDQLLKDSAYANEFKNGYLTHTYLNVNDFHRYFSPVSGKVIEKKIITENMSLDVQWNEKDQGYEVDASTGWQFSETRGYVILETEEHGLVAFVPIGMEQVSSINFYDQFQVGDKINKGFEIGYFLFGASDIIMLFQENTNFQLIAPKDDLGHYLHLLAGEAYGRFEK